MDVQRRYWQEFADLKRDARYIELYQARTEKIDTRLSGFSAIMSSSSIAGWAIWQNLSFVWALAIAMSQVLQAVKEFMPYKKRLKSLAQLSTDLNGLALSAENDWYKVCRGMLTEDEIHELQMKLKKRKQDAVQKSFDVQSLPDAESLLKRAEADTQKYLLSYFGEEHDR
jgi:hypothetical protein